MTTALLSSCAAVPHMGARPEPVAAASVATAKSFAAGGGAAQDAAQWPVDRWWEGYGDPQLSLLVEEALKNSPDVAAATGRFAKASAMAREAHAALLPKLDANGKVGWTSQSLNNFGLPLDNIPSDFAPLIYGLHDWNDNAQVSAVLNFDPDLWGRNRAALAAATSQARAAAVDIAQARLVLASGIASAYADLARLYALRDIRQSELDNREALRKLVTDRVANGLETKASQLESHADIATARTALNEVDESIGLRRNQIAALLGEGPDRGLAITRPNLPQAGIRALPADATINLVGRRPDVVAARDRVEAEASRIKVARASFYPAISLQAMAGLSSMPISNLFQKYSTYGSVGPAVTLPIFHGGELAAQYRGARADYDTAVASYDSTVIEAYRQVADALTSQHKIAERMEDARKAAVNWEGSYGLIQQRYKVGLNTYLDVLSVEQRLLEARLSVAVLEAAARDQDITLIKALGGGFAPLQAADGTMKTKDTPHG